LTYGSEIIYTEIISNGIEVVAIMRVAIYLRCSTKKQSVDNQRAELLSVCSRNDWEVVGEYLDYGISGAKGRDKRQGLDDLMKGVIRKEFDMVVVWSLDRLGRSLADLVGILGDLQAKGIQFYSHKQGMDTSTPTGRMIFHMAGMFAEVERDLIRERVMFGMEKAKERGVQFGRKPISKDKVDSIIKLRKEGFGMTKIAKTLGVGGGVVNRICNEMEA
jgi:DNA invertase Pin-like site-specific DNA recombinase